MIFDGIKFRKNNNVVDLPKKFWVGDNKNYITFGTICNLEDNDAVSTDMIYSLDGLPVYAKPLRCDGHSLTNMMYSGNKLYLKIDGVVYSHTRKNKKIETV
jgi:hypothetical protein